jgi:hypothetical protein
MNPLLRWFLYIAAGVLFLLIFVQLAITFFADDYAANRLRSQIEKGAAKTYGIEFEDLSLNVFSGSATISNISLDGDTASFRNNGTGGTFEKPPKTLYKGNIGEVQVSGFSVISGIWGDELHIGSITITEPDIAALKNPYPVPEDTSGGTFASIDSSIYAAFSDRYSAVEVDDINIRGGHGSFMHSADTLASLKTLNLNLRNIRVDSASAHSGRIFPTDDISIDMRRLVYNLADSINKIKVNKLDISSTDKTVDVDSLELIPRYPRFEYSRENGGIRKDRIDLLMSEFNLSGIDFTALADSGRFYAQYGEINNLRFEDFLNKTFPAGPPKPKTMNHVAFKNAAQPIKIDSLKVNNSFISYTEYPGDTPQAGTITFEQLNGTFRNISNYPEDKRQGLSTTFDARTQVMGSGTLNVHFEFPMDTESGFHKINGTLGSMPIADFNPILEHVAFVRVDDGMLHSLEFDMTLNEDRSNGTLIKTYENLKISVLDRTSIEQRGLKENIFTFLANNLIVRENNMPGEDMQAGRIQFERIKHKSMFNYWWKSLLSGIKDTVK